MNFIIDYVNVIDVFHFNSKKNSSIRKTILSGAELFFYIQFLIRKDTEFEDWSILTASKYDEQIHKIIHSVIVKSIQQLLSLIYFIF